MMGLGICILYHILVTGLSRKVAGTYQFRIGRNSIQMNSQTHPDSSEWYPGQTIVLDISALPGISNYHYDFSRNP